MLVVSVISLLTSHRGSVKVAHRVFFVSQENKVSVKRWGGLVLGCLGLLLSLNAQAVQDPKSITIGLSLPQLANPWYIEAKAGMEKACTELGIKCVAIDAHNSVEKQHDDIQGMIDGQFDAILASALDMGNLTSLYAQAKKQGIITASLAQTIPHSDLYYRELL